MKQINNGSLTFSNHSKAEEIDRGLPRIKNPPKYDTSSSKKSGINEISQEERENNIKLLLTQLSSGTVNDGSSSFMKPNAKNTNSFSLNGPNSKLFSTQGKTYQSLRCETKKQKHRGNSPSKIGPNWGNSQVSPKKFKEIEHFTDFDLVFEEATMQSALDEIDYVNTLVRIAITDAKRLNTRQAVTLMKRFKTDVGVKHFLERMASYLFGVDLKTLVSLLSGLPSPELRHQIVPCFSKAIRSLPEDEKGTLKNIFRDDLQMQKQLEIIFNPEYQYKDFKEK